MPPNQPEVAKKADNLKLRQTTITGQRHSTTLSGSRPSTPVQPETLPTIEDALQFLVDHGYHKKNTPLTVTSMGEMTLKICSKAKMEERKHVFEGMKSIGVLLKELGVEVMKQVTRGKNIEAAVNDIKEGVARTMKEQKQELEEVKKAAEASGKEVKEIMTKIAEGMEAMSGKMKEMDEGLKNRTQNTATTATSGSEQQTYAGAATRIPIGNHARAVARGEEAEKQIVIIGKDKNKVAAEGLKTEKELIAKADMTLKIMTEGGTGPPERFKFIGAFRAKSGAIIYTLNSKEAAIWLKHPDRLKLFNEKFGDSAQAYGKLFNVIAYYVPTTFDAESRTAKSDLELDNGLELLGLAHTRYIKPPHKRSANQVSAHLILGFETRVEANAAIAKRWLTIEGKKVTVKKLIAEPRRCYKCQGVKGDHTADSCPKKEPRCARCAGPHSTNQCDQPDNIRCVNCNSPNHGAASRDCPAFMRSVSEYTQRSPDGNYRFYPILGDAMSMELLDGSYGPAFTNNPTGNKDTHGQANTRTDEEKENDTYMVEDVGLGTLGPANWGEEEQDTQNGDRTRPLFSMYN